MTKDCTIGILKLGAIGAAPLIDLLFDERAERKDIAIRTVTTGASLDEEACQEAATRLAEMTPDLVILVSPNAALPGPKGARTYLLDEEFKVLSISDMPSKNAFYSKDESGKKVPSVPETSGFIILPMDPMIGARKEFLDPTEMTIFNADLIKLLSCTGVMRFLQYELEKLVDSIKTKSDIDMPTLILTPELALEAAGFANPYAHAKAYAALKMAEAVADITTTACFMRKDPDEYVPMVAAAHELLGTAAELAAYAREMEKAGNSVLRTPHSSSGKNLRKTELFEKPD
ncbi:F420-dependent methylenetetrahydromethanopterin dehydrogenase [Candidatus Thorarchaeota archaeon]|nr:MAG: F420-dependent methylenetetrahydromethanopterin dehydrogenase [Candidatus Thorarchaeota archaeon]